jgi:hypothetical protein
MMVSKSTKRAAPASTEATLRALFEATCRDYFPRWITHKRWRVRAGSRSTRTREHGFCDLERRMISVAWFVVRGDPLRLAVTLIHETCHATRGSGHGARFRGRLEQAAKRATALGRPDLARALRDEAEMYTEAHSERPYAGGIYRRLEEYVASGRSPRLAHFVATVAAEYSMTQSEFRSRYRRLGAVMAKARATKLRDAQLRAAFIRDRARAGSVAPTGT